MFAYLMVLQILGIMLAFQTRRVKIKSLKDSTFVAANIYILSIVIVMFILVTFALRSYLNAYSAIFATGIFILTTTFLIYLLLYLRYYPLTIIIMIKPRTVQRKVAIVQPMHACSYSSLVLPGHSLFSHDQYAPYVNFNVVFLEPLTFVC